MATYDAIPRVAEIAGAEIYAKALLLVDEYHRLLFDYSFRHRAITGLLAEMLKFSRATYMSATPIEREFCWMNCRPCRQRGLSDPANRRCRCGCGMKTARWHRS